MLPCRHDRPVQMEAIMQDAACKSMEQVRGRTVAPEWAEEERALRVQLAQFYHLVDFFWLDRNDLQSYFGSSPWRRSSLSRESILTLVR